jgi:hypothetical protein
MDISPLSQSDLINNGMLKYYESLNPDMKRALSRYTTSEYSSLNTLLRDGLNSSNPTHQTSYPNETDWIKQLDKVIDKSPKINRPFRIYRGMILPTIITEKIIRDGYLNNLGYVSTSMDIHTARGFAGDTCCMFNIIVLDPKNISYVYIKTLTKGESEILFQRGTHFKLLSPPYTYKYYPPRSNKYHLITMYNVSIHSGILVPTMKITSQVTESLDPNIKILTSFTRYVEDTDPEDINMLYEDDYHTEIVEEYIRTHPHYTINENMKRNMLHIVTQML